MRKPAVDYSGFKLSRLNEPRFSHLKLLWGWVGYFTLYFLTEALIPVEKCRVVHCWLDDLIPFNELFIIPYFLWYLLIIVSLLYFGLYDVDSFKKLMKYIIVTQVVAMCIYILFPNCQQLRPEVFPRDNVFTRLVAILYAVDTNTNVCPSLHVAYSIGIATVWMRRADSRAMTKAAVLIFCVLVCMSTVFIKQHSFVDTLVAIPVCLLADIIVFGGDRRRVRKMRFKEL